MHGPNKGGLRHFPEFWKNPQTLKPTHSCLVNFLVLVQFFPSFALSLVCPKEIGPLKFGRQPMHLKSPCWKHGSARSFLFWSHAHFNELVSGVLILDYKPWKQILTDKWIVAVNSVNSSKPLVQTSFECLHAFLAHRRKFIFWTLQGIKIQSNLQNFHPVDSDASLPWLLEEQTGHPKCWLRSQTPRLRPRRCSQ